MKSLILITLFFFSFKGNSMEIEELLDKMSSSLKGVNVELNSVYTLYKTAKSKTPHTVYYGFTQLAKNGNYYQKIDQTEFINGTDFSLKISNSEKNAVIGHRLQGNSEQMDISAITSEFSESKIVDKGSYYSVKFVFKPSSSLPYSTVYFRIAKETFYLLQVNLFYSSTQDFSMDRNKQDLHRPHLKIEFKDITVVKRFADNLLDMSRYITLKNSFYHLMGKYSKYELIDNRV